MLKDNNDPVSDVLLEKATLSTKFIFLARKIHLHKIIWKVAKLRKEDKIEEGWCP